MNSMIIDSCLVFDAYAGMLEKCDSYLNPGSTSILANYYNCTYMFNTTY